MGRHAAFELGANPCAKLQGMIIESGRPSLAQFVHGLDAAAAEVLEAAYLGKIQAIDLPVLVIHGELDNLAPVQFAISMYEDFPSLMKRLVIVPGAGHNDLLYVGLNEYFSAIHEFVGRSASPPDQL
jgi:pimeloyl-ACP methyl ester carboxylesterase